jgi:hypothetical protein
MIDELRFRCNDRGGEMVRGERRGGCGEMSRISMTEAFRFDVVEAIEMERGANLPVSDDERPRESWSQLGDRRPKKERGDHLSAFGDTERADLGGGSVGAVVALCLNDILGGGGGGRGATNLSAGFMVMIS